ncbi:hypothetical protein HPB49_012187 [Dermacentor silvarum]|uniref:Uncharacterized protein n=1 Tax=Dermacentor silvarum TaxID=543639 RepID=A0ACB8C9A3_DERSI|nr:hypothetical protein HPB49_012187 [Dermacentor silvarum]
MVEPSGSASSEKSEVTWGMRNWKASAFAQMPLTAKQAEEMGFVQLNSQCAGTFYGFRFMKDNDPSVVLLYDVNGVISGLQSGFHVENSRMHPRAGYIMDTVAGRDIQFLTVYFLPPELICARGRSLRELEEEGVGSNVYLQRETEALSRLVSAPRYDDDLRNSLWVREACYPGMGRHYFWNITEDMACEHLFPVYVTFFRGEIVSFGFLHSLAPPSSGRFERVIKENIGTYLHRPPKCLEKELAAPGTRFSSLHVYLVSKPWEVTCTHD